MNHLTTLFSTVFMILFLSCASENEQKAIDTVAEIYNAKATYSKNFDSKTGRKTIWEFNIEVSDSKLLDTLPKAPLTSNIAFLVYDNFNEKEKNKYQKINVKLLTSSNKTIKNSYDIPVLEEIASRAKTFNLLSEAIVQGNFEETNAYKEDKEIPKSISNFFENHIKKSETKYGKITGYKQLLISKTSDKIGPLTQITGLFSFENGNSIFYATMFYDKGENSKIIGFDFL